MTNTQQDFRWKYNEDKVLADVLTYIKSTYGEHYAHEINDKGMQLFDLWEGMDILAPICQGTAQKYISRYGRKGGYNKKDIYKTIHYCILLLHATRDKVATPSPDINYDFRLPSDVEPSE